MVDQCLWEDCKKQSVIREVKGVFCRHFHRSEGPLRKNFLQIKVEEDLEFLLVQITFEYSEKRSENAAAPQVFAR